MPAAGFGRGRADGCDEIYIPMARAMVVGHDLGAASRLLCLRAQEPACNAACWHSMPRARRSDGMVLPPPLTIGSQGRSGPVACVLRVVTIWPAVMWRMRDGRKGA